MRFEEVYKSWTKKRLTQEEAAELLGVCARTFRRHIDRYEDEGLDGLMDHRMDRVSQLRAPVDEVMQMVNEYRTRHDGWNVRHYYSWYRRDGGERSYNWVRTKLQEYGAVAKGSGRGVHRKRRQPAAWPGMMPVFHLMPQYPANLISESVSSAYADTLRDRQFVLIDSTLKMMTRFNMS